MVAARPRAGFVARMPPKQGVAQEMATGGQNTSPWQTFMFDLSAPYAKWVTDFAGWCGVRTVVTPGLRKRIL